VVKYNSFQTFYAISSHKNWPLFHLDVKTIFLNGKIKEDVYIQHLQGYIILGKETQVYKLKRALYGLKLFPRVWYTNIGAHIYAQGLQRSNANDNLYFTHAIDGRIAILLLYVDDISLEIMPKRSTSFEHNFNKPMTWRIWDC
jgi:hypothetical protein